MLTPRRTLITLTVTALCALAPAAFAQAATLTLRPASAAPGTPTSVVGSGYGAGEPVDVSLDGSVIQETVATAAGAVSTNLPLPAAVNPGQHQVTAVGHTSGNAGGATLTVTTPWNQEG